MEGTHKLLLDGTVDMFANFEGEHDEYDDSLHCIQRFDQELRGLAWIPQDRVRSGWQCAVYINALSEDGVSFSVSKNGREPRPCTRHTRIHSDAKPGVWNVTLEYVLLVWMGKEPTAWESAEPAMGIDQKVLVLLCDFYNSSQWVRQLEAWKADPDAVPDSIADRWDALNVVVVGLDSADKANPVRIGAKCRKFY